MKRWHDSTGSVASAVLVIAVVLFVLALAGVVASAWVFGYIGQPSGEPKPVQVEIPKGSSTESIADVLARRGIIGNSVRFRIRARVERADGRLRAGVYDLSTNMPDEFVIERLTSGPAIKYETVTIPEGFTLRRIAERYEKEAGIEKDEFLRLAKTGARDFAEGRPYLADAYGGSLEGFLFPKTYRIREGSTARDVIEMMLTQFDREIEDVDVAAAQRRGLDVYELVTLASLVEREARVAKDRPLIASVIGNRLERDMRLELCSTVDYALNKSSRSFRLTIAETRTDSPYNTYRHRGLPPGPIASPGLESLKAAAQPAETSYVYFVLTGNDGSHTFASDDAGFLAAKRKSKEVFGE